MSDEAPLPAHSGPYRRPRHKYERGTKVRIDGLPSPEELAQAHDLHKGDDADRFSLYTPEQIEHESRTVRLILTFEDVIKVRDQAEMVIACMQQIIACTRRHDIGSIRQRIDARREAASLGAALTFFNGKTPYGYRKRKQAIR